MGNKDYKSLSIIRSIILIYKITYRVFLTFGIIFLMSCNPKKETTKIISNDLPTKKTEILNSSHIPIGDWKLIKINSPWNKEPLFPKNVIWNINSNGELKIIKKDSLIDRIFCDFEFVSSGFSSDSVWVMKGNFKNEPIIADLEIWINQHEMKLIDQCDDCFSFEFKRVK